jgi:hypothetical protein
MNMVFRYREMKHMRILKMGVLALAAGVVGIHGAQVIGGRLDLNQLAVTGGLEQKYGTYMIDIPPMFTVHDLKVALAKRERIPVRMMDIVVARQTLDNTKRVVEAINEVTDNKVYLRIKARKRQ